MTVRNVEIILGGLGDAVRYCDSERIAGFLAPGLVGDGVSPGLRCERREQAAMAAADASTAHWR